MKTNDETEKKGRGGAPVGTTEGCTKSKARNQVKPADARSTSAAERKVRRPAVLLHGLQQGRQGNNGNHSHLNNTKPQTPYFGRRRKKRNGW